MSHTDHDPYERSQQKVVEPPTTFLGKLRYLGPGFILTACIVGSGELIATTLLGAKAGFVAMWIILASCFIKVMVQLEFGKHAIHSGETTFTALNQLPGPRFGKGGWATWLWLLMMLIKPMQLGGIIGGVGMVLHMIVPSIPVWAWVLACVPVVSLMIFRGRYALVEKGSVILVGLFGLFTLACVIVLQSTDMAVSREDLIDGLSFWNGIPFALLGVAIAAFGLTGVGGDEIMAYNYWLLEKGYAAKTGPRDDSPEWNRRAQGWIRVMYWDAFLSMIVYTILTVAFYLLGAAVLHSQGLVPKGYETISVLSRMYTDALGPWAEKAFLIGAFFVLFSTLFSALAGWTRLFSDAFGAVGWIDYLNPRSRGRSIAFFSFFFPIVWAILFFVLEDPVFMVLAGGAITAAILLIVVFASVHFRYRRLPQSLRPSWCYDLGFWLSVLAIVALAVISVVTAIQKFVES